MSLATILIVIGIILAIFVSFWLGIAFVAAGLFVLVWPIAHR